MNLKNIIAKCVVGSKLYGLETPSSDTDYVSVYVSDNLSEIIGLDREYNVSKVTDDEDNCYFEVRSFLSLCRKGSTKALELLYAPKDKFEILTSQFEQLRNQKNYLFDSSKFLKSINGYLQGEYRLALGERTGRLGGNRKENIDNFGFSPKNVCQMMRLYRASKHYFTYGVFPCCIADIDQEYHDKIYDIKLNPQNYDRDDIITICDKLINDFKQIDFENCHHSKYQSHIVDLNLMDIYNLKLIRK